MKNKVLSFAIALIALFAFNTAQAQNAHFTNVKVSEDGLTITGKIAGLGNKYTGQTFTVRYGSDVIGTMTCTNPAGIIVEAKTKTYSLETASTTPVTGKNGHVKFTLNINTSNTSLSNERCEGDPKDGVGLTTKHTFSGTGAKTLSFTVGILTKEMTL